MTAGKVIIISSVVSVSLVIVRDLFVAPVATSIMILPNIESLSTVNVFAVVPVSVFCV